MGRTKTIEDQEILNHARRIFHEGGQAASTRDVARAAGISQAVLYQRFGSKEELFFRAMAPEAPDIDMLLGAYPPRSVLKDLQRIGTRITDHVRMIAPTLLHVLAARGAHEKLVQLHERLTFRPLVEALTQRFAQLRDDGLVADIEPGAAAQAFLAIVHVAVLGELVGHSGGHRGGASLEELLKVFWHGISPRPASKPIKPKK